MVKKVFTFAVVLLFSIVSTATMAQNASKSVSINQNDVAFWVGTGSNSTLICIGWDDADASYTPTVVVWGIHWNGTITLLDALDTLSAYDTRFTYTMGSSGFLTGLSYVDPSAGVNLTPSMGWNCNNYNGVYGQTNLSTSMWLRISESTCSDYDFTTVNTLIYASDPNASTDPVDATIDFDDILYWVGTGSNEAAFIISFAEPDTALAWGFRYNQATIQDMIDSLAAADPRLTIVGNPSYMGDLYFVNAPGDTLRLSPVDPNIGYNFWWTNLNGLSVASYTTALQDGDYFKFGDLNSATGWDFQGGYYMQEAWTTEVHPVSIPGSDPVEPTPEDAEITASDILYWVGNGNNKVVFAINWADTALAWGYKFSTDSVFVSEIIGAIVAADPRLSIEGDSTYVSDFHYADANITDTLGITPHDPNDWSIYFNMQVNHVSSMIGAAGHAVGNGDFVKFADTYVAVKADSTWIDAYGGYWDYTYVWPMAIHPVSVPTTSRISAVSTANLSVYPNPASSSMCVVLSEGSQATDAVLFDMAGRQVRRQAIAAGSERVVIDVNQLSAGIYMLRVGTETVKVAVRH